MRVNGKEFIERTIGQHLRPNGESMPGFNTLANAIISNPCKQTGITFIASEKKEEFLSYYQLYNHAKILLFKLQAYGLKPGDELLFQFQSDKNFIITFWACILGKIVPVPLSFVKTGELKFFKVWEVLLNPYLITDYPGFNRFLMSLPGSGITSKIKDKVIFFPDLQVNIHQASPVEIKPGDISFIQFSSGSTGNPKGVINTHHSLMNNIREMTAAIKIADSDRFLSWMPLTHDLGLILFHLLALVNNKPQILLSTNLFIRRPSQWMLKASDHKATILGSPNFGYRHFLNNFNEDALANCSLESVKAIINGGEPISSQLCREFSEKMSKYSLKKKCYSPGLRACRIYIGGNFHTPGGRGY